MVTLRIVRPDDLNALYAISLATGHQGGDASHLYADGSLLGHIYAAPYGLLAPGLAFVLDDGLGPAGFALGVAETPVWEAQLERDWWPKLRQLYPDPDVGLFATWTPDQRRAHMIHHPARTPREIVDHYPAHLHINLLPRIQGRGWGTRLLQVWSEAAGRRGVRAIHVGVNRANGAAARFWSARGFRALDLDAASAGRTLWMGRP